MKGFKIELEENILRFWMNKMVDYENGGFYGEIDGNNQLQVEAKKGVVMYTRILWTFSAAYRVLGNPSYRELADRAFDYILQYFIDSDFGGVYWSLDYQGNVYESKKQTYAQGFALYAFSEYYRATQKKEALELSIEFFHIIEQCKDVVKGGYWEAFTRDWQPIEDMRLSEKDENEVKTMNTHLHVLEPYTNLLRIWKDPKVIEAHTNLINVFVDKIYDSNSGHLKLFFNDDWAVKGDAISYGHDIEASWLLLEAVDVLGNDALRQKVQRVALHIGVSAKEGLLADGSMAYELKSGHFDAEKHWWVQAEAVIGFKYLAKLSNDSSYDSIAQKLWMYIQSQLVDREHGEWYWSRLSDGSINKNDDKAGFWKCPYHNSRMCLEMIEYFSINS